MECYPADKSKQLDVFSVTYVAITKAVSSGKVKT